MKEMIKNAYSRRLKNPASASVKIYKDTYLDDVIK
jgi:hypothetical protein